MSAVGIEHLAGAKADSQPLGVRRLIEVARIIVSSPSVVLFDEIASGLDETEIDDLSQVIVDLRNAGATIVLVEHNFGLVLRISDTVVVLANGEVIARGSPADI